MIHLNKAWLIPLLFIMSSCATVIPNSQPENSLQAAKIIQSLELESEYPFKAHFIQTKHGRMHYIDEGSGNPVLMLHGNPTWSFLYRNFVKGLSGHHRTIAPDLIGFGLSEKPSDISKYSIQAHVDDIEKLLLKLDLKNVTLVIHDWGGPIGLAVAARHPERIKTLVIMNTFGSFPPSALMDENDMDLPFMLSMLRAPILGEVMVRQMGMFEGMGMRMATAKEERLKAVEQAYQGVFTGYDDRAGVLAFPRLIPDNLQHPSAQLIRNNVEPYIAQFKGPVLIFWGEQDPFFTEDMLELWQARLPQAKTVKIHDASHYIQEDAYEQIVPKIKRFLKKNNL